MSNYSCSNCGKRYKTARTLNNHKKTSETCAPFQYAYFTCMKCGKGYENMKDFRIHARHCRGSKTSYRIPEETRWQTRCTVLEGMIEATLGVVVPSIEFNHNQITLGSLRELKNAVKRRIRGEDSSTNPIPIVLDNGYNKPEPESNFETDQDKPESVSESESDHKLVVKDSISTIFEPDSDSDSESDSESESVVVEETKINLPAINDTDLVEWENYSSTMDIDDILNRYSITNDSRPATHSEITEYRERYLTAAVTILKQKSELTTVKFVLTKIREKLVSSLSNYDSPVVYDVCRVYNRLNHCLMMECGWSEENAKTALKDYMLPYPLIRLTDLLPLYRDVVPVNNDEELLKQLVSHYFQNRLDENFSKRGGGIIFQVFRYNYALDRFIFIPQRWWEKGCYYAPQRSERNNTNPITFVMDMNGKKVYDYFLMKFGEKIYGEITESIRSRFRDIYHLIHETNEYVDDWETDAGVYREDLYNLLRSYLQFYSDFSVNQFADRLRFIIAEEAVTENQKLNFQELKLGPPPDKKDVKKDLDKLKVPGIYHRVFDGFQALFDTPQTRKFWDSATGINGDGGWFFDEIAYEEFLRPRFHRLFRCMCSESFYQVTSGFEQTHDTITKDSNISASYPEIPLLKIP
jgi:hypothetical protein